MRAAAAALLPIALAAAGCHDWESLSELDAAPADARDGDQGCDGNRIPDGDLEGSLVDWFALNGRFEIATGEGRGGGTAIRMCNDNNDVTSCYGFARDVPPIAEGAYVLSAWARLGAGADQQIRPVLRADDWTWASQERYFPLADDWTPIEIGQTVPAGDGDSVAIEFQVTSTVPTDCYLVDDVCLLPSS